MSRQKNLGICHIAIEIEFLFDEILIRKFGKKEEKIRLGALFTLNFSAPASKETCSKQKGEYVFSATCGLKV